MMRTVLAATKSAKRISTAATINPTIPASSLADERRGAPDLHHVHALARFDHTVLVVAARGPYFAVESHASDPLIVVDALEDHCGASDQRRRTRADLRRHVDVTPCDRAHHGEADRGQDRECRPGD